MKILKRVLLVLGVVIVLLVVAVVALYYSTASRLTTTYEITPRVVQISRDSASIARGRHWVEVYCTHCHGDQLQGNRMFEDPDIGRIDASNLTTGAGGVGGTYQDADWVRAIRHGVRPNGSPLLVMPAYDYAHFSDRDLGDVIAYVSSVPPVDNRTEGYELSFLAHVLAAFGAFGDFLSAEVIDHDARPVAPERGVTAAYGDYLTRTAGCRTCHGTKLAGGKDPNPNAPPGPNLTPGGRLASWSEEDFITTIRSGFTPDKRPLQAAFMPWNAYSRYSDDELRAIWMYLKSLPALPTIE